MNSVLVQLIFDDRLLEDFFTEFECIDAINEIFFRNKLAEPWCARANNCCSTSYAIFHNFFQTKDFIISQNVHLKVFTYERTVLAWFLRRHYLIARQNWTLYSVLTLILDSSIVTSSWFRALYFDFWELGNFKFSIYNQVNPINRRLVFNEDPSSSFKLSGFQIIMQFVKDLCFQSTKHSISTQKINFILQIAFLCTTIDQQEVFSI